MPRTQLMRPKTIDLADDDEVPPGHCAHHVLTERGCTCGCASAVHVRCAACGAPLGAAQVTAESHEMRGLAYAIVSTRYRCAECGHEQTSRSRARVTRSPLAR